MFERDYLMKILADFVQAIVRSLQQVEQQGDAALAAETVEGAVGTAVNMDAATFLCLSPASIASILHVSGTDPSVMEYIARSLALAAAYRREAGDEALATLRAGQARAIAEEFNIVLDAEDFGEGDDGGFAMDAAVAAARSFFTQV